MAFDEKAYMKTYRKEHASRLKAYHKAYYQEHKQEIDEKNKEWVKTHPKQRIAICRRYYAKVMLDYNKRRKISHDSMERQKKYPYETIAREKVRAAIRKGNLRTRPCESCGAKKAEAHHDDYNKPLEIRWLCSECHKKWHKYNEPIRVTDIKKVLNNKKITASIQLNGLIPAGIESTGDILRKKIKDEGNL